MNIADIDLDIFLDDVCSIDRRPRAQSTTRPWNEAQLRVFLEDQCGLKRDPSAQRPKGWFVVHHDEAFPILEALSQNGDAPVILAHIDAHSDLGTGFGDSSWMDIGGRLLGLPPKERVTRHPAEWHAAHLASQLSIICIGVPVVAIADLCAPCAERR
ncbi:hypothetical protein [Ensifer sp. LCM 4579]|uniref:hypothetical protein n=1 Tax=Ensifer sp. LCM 4579 TaxID=1848292 RepID=UPI0010426BAB|nr:hypothetical protein [Ensifer sp. LCM 4579]